MAKYEKQYFGALGFDANGHRVINVASPVEGGDATNLEYFDIHNTIIEYDPNRGYIKGFVAYHNSKLYISTTNINKPAGNFKTSQWVAMSSSPTWIDYNETKVGGQELIAGSFVKYTTEYNNLEFILPDSANDGEVINFMDYGNFLNKNSIKVISNNQNIVTFPFISNEFYLTQPLTQYTFVYTERQWKPFIYGKTGNENIFLKTPNHKSQVNEHIYRTSSIGEVTIVLPEFANHGDKVYLYDLDNDTSFKPITITVGESDYSINGKGKQAELFTLSGEMIVFDNERKEWILFDLDHSKRRKVITNNYVASPADNLLVYPPVATKDIVVTLPSKSAFGDSVDLSLTYMVTDQKITIKSTSENILMYDSMAKPFLRYSEMKTKVVKEGLEFVFYPVRDNVKHITISKLSNTTGDVYWVITDITRNVEAVDKDNIDRYGVAKIASQAEVNNITTGDRESIVTPFTLNTRKSDEVKHGLIRIATLEEVIDGVGLDNVVVPEKLNKKVSKKDDIGLIRLATQAEVDRGDDDKTAVTPHTLHRKVGKEGGVLGIATLTNTTGTKTSTTKLATDGTNIYDVNDNKTSVTPKALNQLIATNNSYGLGYRSNDSDLLNAESKDATYWDIPTFVTPEVFIKRISTTSRTGITKYATTAESLQLTNDKVSLTPKSVRNIVSTTKLYGLSRFATQEEYYNGFASSVITPKDSKDHFTSVKFKFVANGSNDMGLLNFSEIWKKDALLTATLNRSSIDLFGVAKASNVNYLTDENWAVNTTFNYVSDEYVTPNTLKTLVSTNNKQGLTIAFDIGSTGTFDSLFKKQVTDRTRSNNEFHVTPNSLKSFIHDNADSRSKTNKWGTTRLGSNTETFVGNGLDGSTGTSYKSDISVTPSSLIFALSHYLPLTAKAFDSNMIDGNESSNLFLLNRDNDVKTKQTFVDVGMSNLVAKDTIKTKDVYSDNYNIMDTHYMTATTSGITFNTKGGSLTEINANGAKITNGVSAKSLSASTSLTVGGSFAVRKMGVDLVFGNGSVPLQFSMLENQEIVVKKGTYSGVILDTLNFDKHIDSVYVGINNDQGIIGQKTFHKGILFDDRSVNSNGYRYKIVSGEANISQYPPYEYKSRNISNGKMSYVGPKYSEGILETFQTKFGSIETWRPFGSNKSYQRRKTSAGIYTEWDEMVSYLNLPTTDELSAININETNFVDISVSGNLDIIGKDGYEGMRLRANKDKKVISAYWVSERE